MSDALQRTYVFQNCIASSALEAVGLQAKMQFQMSNLCPRLLCRGSSIFVQPIVASY